MNRDQSSDKLKVSKKKRTLSRPHSQERLSSNAAINSIATTYYRILGGARRPQPCRRKLTTLAPKAKVHSVSPSRRADDLSRLIVLSEVLQEPVPQETEERSVKSRSRIHDRFCTRKRTSLTPSRQSPDRGLPPVAHSRQGQQREYFHGLAICPLQARRAKETPTRRACPKLPIYKTVTREAGKDEEVSSPPGFCSPWEQEG